MLKKWSHNNLEEVKREEDIQLKNIYMSAEKRQQIIDELRLIKKDNNAI